MNTCKKNSVGKIFYDGKLSMGLLAQPLRPVLATGEHFRCVAPIIQFSNELSYAREKR